MKSSIKQPALSKVLSVVLPTQEQTLLLRACLWSGDPGRKAWAEWLGRVGNPVELLRDGNERLKSLLPLISFALRRNGIDVEEDLKTCLYMSSLREELRNKAYHRILGRVLSFYAESQIPVIVLKGAALADTVYESPALRHSGKIQILIGGVGSSAGASSLLPPEFLPLHKGFDREWNVMILKHNSGLPLHLHRSLFPISYYDIPFEDLWVRSQVHRIAGRTAHTLATADNLLHVCGDAFFSRSRRSLLWVFDSWFIINKSADLDWDGLLATARSSHLELPLSVTLGYLAEQMNAPIPESFISSLYNYASAAKAKGRAHALTLGREEIKGNYIKMFLIGENWRARVYLVNWVLFSPMSHLKWFRQNFRPKFILSRYVFGPLRNLISRTSRSMIETSTNNKDLRDD